MLANTTLDYRSKGKLAASLILIERITILFPTFSIPLFVLYVQTSEISRSIPDLFAYFSNAIVYVLFVFNFIQSTDVLLSDLYLYIIIFTLNCRVTYALKSIRDLSTLSSPFLFKRTPKTFLLYLSLSINNQLFLFPSIGKLNRSYKTRQKGRGDYFLLVRRNRSSFLYIVVQCSYFLTYIPFI